jgi:hypothetical protein
MVDLSKTAASGAVDFKTVTVFSTLGKQAQEFQSKATTWTELQKEMGEFRISYSGMKAVIGETRLTLESPNALLPSTNFTLFLMPVKTKSGTDLSRAELFVAIKDIVSANAAAKSYFIVDGKNMTQLSTPKLNELYNSYHGTATASVPTPKTKNVADVVSSVSNAKSLEENLEKAKSNYKKAVAADADEDTLDILLEKITVAKAALKNAPVAKAEPVKAEEPKETEAQKATRLEKERKAKLDKELADQANDLMKDFSDVKR